MIMGSKGSHRETMGTLCTRIALESALSKTILVQKVSAD